MDIKEFVRNTIVQVVEGVNSASLELKESGSKVLLGSQVARGVGVVFNSNGEHINSLDFDIAVVAVEKDSISGGAGLKIAGVNLGGSTKNELSNQSISRIQFSVPIQFALQETTRNPN